jgi:hypothetical protein
MRDQKRAVIEIEAKVPPDEAWEESETWWIETTKYYGAMNPYIFKGPRWVLTADFPNQAAAARFAGMLFRAEKRASGARPAGLLDRILA